jgi:Ferritin-like domain
MKQPKFEHQSNRRSFLKKSALATSAAMVGVGLFGANKNSLGQDSEDRITEGDIAILRFLAAAELIESDLWTQYRDLGGLNPGQVPVEVNPNQPMNGYQAALSNLDTDGPQYITSNTLDEISHATFLNAYLKSKGAQAITITNRTAIPITNADFADVNHIQVIANTAAFHFGFIEQGGSSLYAALSQKVTSLEVLKITLGIGGDEIAHFLEWVDFSGNGVQPPVAPVSDQGLTFPNFFVTPGTPLFQPNLIFPVPCEFISADLPDCSVIRPSDDRFAGAQAAVAALTADGLFLGQTPKFFDVLQQMAEQADAAIRQL